MSAASLSACIKTAKEIGAKYQQPTAWDYGAREAVRAIVRAIEDLATSADPALREEE